MRRAIATAVGTALASLVITSPATAGDGFATFPTCGGFDDSDSRCVVGDGWGAAFLARSGDREKYKLCVTPPRGSTWCRKNRTDGAGVDFDRLYTEFDTIGTYTMVWKKGGHVLDRDRMFLDIGD